MSKLVRRRLSLRSFSQFLLAALLGAASVSVAQGPPEWALDKANPRVREVMAIQERMTPAWMATPGVLGTATGLDEAGNVAVILYVDERGPGVDDLVRAIPASVGSTPVVVERTEPFRALRGRPGTAVSHTASQTAPIQLGTSGGWRYNLSNGYCCGGTLGSLIQIGGTQYILSNYHVLEADTVAGGNNRVAQTGDPVVQPGLIDAGCSQYSTQNVGTLRVSNALPGGNVDAAVAAVADGMVRSDGAILEIGTLSAQTVEARLGQPVKKSGRTTGLSRSKVSALNASVSIVYDDECAGAVAFTKVFTGQIVIGNKASRFLASGDSGSLLVEDVDVNPRAVGLLFAGSSSQAIANPIGDVLDFFGATMVGQ